MRQRRLCAVLAWVMLVTALLTPALAAETEAPEAEPYRYRYTLEADWANPGAGTDPSTVCTLYVQALSDDAVPLHAGSVTLGIPGSVVSVQAEGPFELRDFDGKPNAWETGTALGQSYLGFSWNRTETEDPLTQDGEHRQKIATIRVSGGAGKVSAFTLIPWVDTRTGKLVLQQRQQAQASGDAVRIDEQEAVMRNVWRYESLTTADVGFYQGFYEIEEDGPDGQRAVDIENGWQAFQIMAYNSKEPITLKFEQWNEEVGAYAQYAEAEYQLAGPTQVGQNGKFTATIDFAALKDTEGQAIAIGPGEYKLTVSKRSHVSRYATGLTIKGNEGNLSIFPELTGVMLYLPCGDVNGDDRIKLQDRGQFTAPERYGRPVRTGEEAYDLNGDGRIDLRDLMIMEDPINYGRSSTAFYEKTKTTQGGGA